jgi:hypothetical protein
VRNPYILRIYKDFLVVKTLKRFLVDKCVKEGVMMIILKHVEHKLKDLGDMERLLSHLKETTSRIDGVELKDIYFLKDKEEFVLALDCTSEDKYLEWREICPPPPGARDWYEVLLTRDEHFS